MFERPIMIVSLSIPKRYEDEFNDFYHHEYIPNLLTIIPEIVSARRFEEYNTDGSLRYLHKQWLTVYELESDAAIPAVQAAIKLRQGRDRQKQRWLDYERLITHKQSHRLYTLRYAHPRRPWDGPFCGRPFYMVSVEVKPEKLEDFNDWYEKIFLRTSLADVPTWQACRRYSSIAGIPSRQLTIFEAADEAGLRQSLELMRAKWRLNANESWQQWDGGDNPAIVWEDATSFTPIYRYPD